MRRFDKRGYFFIIDAFIGATIIFLALMIILNSSTRPTNVQYNYEIAEEYATFILNTKIQDLNNIYVNKLINSSVINDTSLTIMEQVDLFYNNSDITHAHDMIKNLTEPLIPQKYGFSYNIVDGTNKINIYSRPSPSINNANIVIASRKITFLQLNSTSMFGPAMVEIKIWI